MESNDLFKIGLIINPIAGMGGAVGLKGTDGLEIVEEAKRMQAKPNAQNRCLEFLKSLTSIKKRVKFFSCPGDMGESILKNTEFQYEIINLPIFKTGDKIYETNREHTLKAAEAIKSINNIIILVFIGGDGTARDILESVNQDIPCLGIPAGVKIYSSAFANNPKAASDILMQFLWDELPLREAEVLDIDEEQFRQGKLSSSIYGHLIVPFEPNYSQYSKMATLDSNEELSNQERIANRIVEDLENEVLYLLGPGTTVKAVADVLNVDKSLLGVDILQNKKIIERDVNESQILHSIENKKVKIIITPIGRQGFLFGRGNLQISDKVLKQIGTENIVVIATRYKFDNLAGRKMRIDTRNPEFDEEIKGEYKVIVDYDDEKICNVD